MKYRNIIILFLVCILFVFPVLAQTIGSIHTTDTDFNDATELTNVSVIGVDKNAKIDLFGRFDNFENQSTDSGSPEEWENVASPDSQNITTVKSYSGTQSYYIDSSSLGVTRPIELPYDKELTTNISIVIFANSPTGEAVIRVNSLSSRIGFIGIKDGDLKYFDGSWNTISTTPNSGEWVKITLYDWDPNTDTYQIKWETTDNSGTGTANSENTFTTGWSNILIRTNGLDAFYDDYKIISPKDGTYISKSHLVNNPKTGFTNITVNNVTTSVSWLEDTNNDGIFETSINNSTFTTTGNHSLDISNAQTDNIRVNVTFVNSGSNPVGELHDEGIFVEEQEEIEEQEFISNFNELLEPTELTNELSVIITVFTILFGYISYRLQNVIVYFVWVLLITVLVMIILINISFIWFWILILLNTIVITLIAIYNDII